MEELGHDDAGQSAHDGAASVSVLPALAEMHRRAGRADEAEQVARRGLEFEPKRAEARVVLALALLDQKRPDEARNVLEPLATALLSRHGLDTADAPTPPRAREAAPPIAERVVPAPRNSVDPLDGAGRLDGVGEAVVSDAELDEAFEVARPERENMIDADSVAQQAIRAADRELAEELGAPAAPPFATHTIADLLESQGDPDSARRIRAALESGAEPTTRSREALLAELERWLENLRRPRA